MFFLLKKQQTFDLALFCIRRSMYVNTENNIKCLKQVL